MPNQCINKTDAAGPSLYPNVKANEYPRRLYSLSNEGDLPSVEVSTSGTYPQDQFIPTAPVLSDLDEYAELDTTPQNNFDLPPPTYSSLNLQKITTPTITEAEVRQKFKDYVRSQPLWDNEPVNNIEILSITSGNAYHYKLETFSERRTHREHCRPYDGLYVGPDPAKVVDAAAVWEIQVQPTEFFQPDLKRIEMPGSSRVGFCDKCFGEKHLKCSWCSGKGWNQCPCCKLAIQEQCCPPGQTFGVRFGQFSGRNSRLSLDITDNLERQTDLLTHGSDGSYSRSSSTLIRQRRTVSMGLESRRTPCNRCAMSCHGQGRSECTYCAASGQVRCRSCGGFGRVQRYTEVSVSWSVNTGERISGMGCDLLSEVELRKAQGALVNESTQLRVDPLSPTDDALYQLSQDLIQGQVAQCEVSKEALKRQRFALKEVPVTVVRYACGNYYGRFAIFGRDGQLYAKEYPSVYASTCSMVAQSWLTSFVRAIKVIQQNVLRLPSA